MARPVIGINADYRGVTHGQAAFSYLAAGYYDSIANAGRLPIILPPAAG